jgi:hypothetical protein
MLGTVLANSKRKGAGHRESIYDAHVSDHNDIGRSDRDALEHRRTVWTALRRLTRSA